MTQGASVSGSGNVVVQIIGDGNEVLLEGGQARLRLTRYANRHSTNPSELDFLSPYSRALPLIGRKQELETLTQWLDSSRPISIAVWVGLPGTGKTRLALELVERASGQGWNAGFVKSDELARFTEQGASWVWNCKTLIVVDDPVKQAPILARWFQTLADDERTPKHPFRILVVERHADQDSGWWSTVFESHGHDSRMVRRLLDPDHPVMLSRIADPDEQRQIFSEALNRIQAAQSVPPTAPEFDRASERQAWLGEPLFLIMAALVASSKGLRYVLSLNRTDLAHELAKNERDRIKEIAQSHNVAPPFLAHMAAIVTLSRGMSFMEARASASEERSALSFTGSDTDPPRLVDALTDALVNQSDAYLPLAPDILGEAFVLLLLHGNDGLSAILRAARRTRSKNVAITIIRIAQDYVSTDQSDEVRYWFSEIIESNLPLSVLEEISDAISYSTLALRDEALRLQEIIVEQVRALADIPQLAMSLSNLGGRLNAVGRHEEALSVVQEAVDLYRMVTHPDIYRPHLAASLHNLGAALGAIGRRGEAVTATKEAVTVYRVLSATYPDDFLSNLAGSLNNLGVQLGDIGQRDEALAVAQETVLIRRKLAATQPNAFLPDLAISLSNLGNRLHAVGRRDEALATAQEAVLIRRELAVAQPHAFLPTLAVSLNNVGVMLKENGRCDEALTTAQEAVNLYRELATTRANSFRSNLAASLNNLGNRLHEVGRNDEALMVTKEAIDIKRELAANYPETFQPDLASSLNNFGNHLSAVGRHNEALATAREAVLIYRELMSGGPATFSADLAGSLSNLGGLLGAAGRQDEAIAATQEAVNLYREVVATHPSASRQNLAMSLNNLGAQFCAVGQRDEALAAVHEALNIYRELAETHFDAFRPRLANSLKLLGIVLDSLGHDQEAQVAFAQAAEFEN